ncbi:MAG TPA: hypothetical protein VLA04_01260 [Verrucomicrobiae bacterium]|nr:hypothetical protein [Verrucomicrobiae bacterium]
MSWKKTNNLIGNSLARHGLSAAVLAGTVCQEAERLYPGMFRASSLVNGTLNIHLPLENQMKFRHIEGKLLQDLKIFTTGKNLPVPTRIRLTISPSSATV